MILTFEEYAKLVHSWYEKAEKWDKYTKEPEAWYELNFQATSKLEQENKQLKEDLETHKQISLAANHIDMDLRRDNNSLKQKLEKIKELREFHSGKGTVTQFSHADIFNELEIIIKEHEK